MKSLVVVAAVAAGLSATAAPAAAGGYSRFELSAGRVSAYGTYDSMMSIPERPVPPLSVTGTLAVNGRTGCGVVQIAGNGPADGIVWRTLARRCRPGKTNFRDRPGFLWGGAKPQLRLCAGRTVAQAERGRRCDVHTPPAER